MIYIKTNQTPPHRTIKDHIVPHSDQSIKVQCGEGFRKTAPRGAVLNMAENHIDQHVNTS